MWSSSPSPSPTFSSSRNSYGYSSSPEPDNSWGRGRGSSYQSRTPSPWEDMVNPQVKVGDRVIVRSNVGDAKTGILQYVGEVDFAKGLWAGVELFYPQGRNDGTVRGIEYFRCKHPYGIFVPLRKVDLSPVNGINITPRIVEGGNEDEEHSHEHHHHVYGKCDVHDKILWNTEAVMGSRVTGVRNPNL